MKLMIPFAVVLALVSACGSQNGDTFLPLEDDPAADTLRVTMTMGTEFGDSTETFGLLTHAEYHLGTGNIIVLDAGRASLLEYSPGGEYLRKIARQGDGPGELSNFTLEFFQMGGRLLAGNMMKMGFVVFDDTLAFVEEISHWTQNPPMQCFALSDSTFAAYKVDFAEADGENLRLYRRIVSYSYDNKDYDFVFWADSVEFTISQLISGGSSSLINDFLFGLTLDGNEDLVVFALRESEEYRVLGWLPDGSEAFQITMDMQPVAKTPEEIAEEKAYMEGFMSQMGAQGMTEFEPEPFRDMVRSVAIGPDGNIWVLRGTRERPLFDLYSTGGELLGHRVFEKTGWTWAFSFSEHGILAWEEDPLDGYQVLHLVE